MQGTWALCEGSRAEQGPPWVTEGQHKDSEEVLCGEGFKVACWGVYDMCPSLCLSRLQEIPSFSLLLLCKCSLWGTWNSRQWLLCLIYKHITRFIFLNVKKENFQTVSLLNKRP